MRRFAILLTATLALGPAVPHTAGSEQVHSTAPSGAKGEPFIRVTLLGTGNPRPTTERFGPSALVEAGSHRILIDAGRGAAIRLFQIGRDSLLSGIDRVLLTHLHSDHVVGLPDLWLTGWIFGRSRPLAIDGPTGTVSMMRHLEQAYAFDIEMRRDVDERFPGEGIALSARDVEPGVIARSDDLKITAFVVDHGPVAPAYGYRIDHAGYSVVFSGDTRPSDNLVKHAEGVDLLVHEVISPEVERRLSLVHDPEKTARIIDHHTTPEDAGRIFSRVRPRLAVYSHIVPSPAKAADLIGATRATFEGPLEVGHDLMTITVGERIEIGRVVISEE